MKAVLNNVYQHLRFIIVRIQLEIKIYLNYSQRLYLHV